MIFLLSILSLSVTQVNATGDYWTQRKSAPASISLSAATVVNDQVYVIGGLSAVTAASGSGEPVPSNIVYDPAGDSWKTLAPMPTVREALGAVAVNGKIYAIGGSSSTGTSNANEEYDTVNNRWTSMTSLPDPTSAFAAAPMGSTIYVMGGIDSRGPTTKVWAFDTVHNTWSPKSDMPAVLPAAGLGFSSPAIAVNDRIYVAPRNTWHESSVNTSLVYNVAIDTWSDSWPGPPFRNNSGNNVSVYAYAMTLSGPKIFLLGGVDANYRANALPYNFQYDTVSGNWTRGKDMPTPRTGLVAVTVNGLVYAIGGGGSCSAGTSGSCYANEVYVPSGDQAPLPARNQSGSGIDWTIIGIVAIGGSVVVVVAAALYYRLSRKHASSSQSLPPA